MICCALREHTFRRSHSFLMCYSCCAISISAPVPTSAVPEGPRRCAGLTISTICIVRISSLCLFAPAQACAGVFAVATYTGGGGVWPAAINASSMIW